jgi:hypothetical protein
MGFWDRSIYGVTNRKKLENTFFAYRSAYLHVVMGGMIGLSILFGSLNLLT